VRLLNVTASAHPDGNRIDLHWSYPDKPDFPGVAVVRREGGYPATPDDGTPVAEGVGLTSATDCNLKGETVYYYTLFPFVGTPPVFDTDTSNRVSATATGRYDFAGQMYALLPAIYHRYDQTLAVETGTGCSPQSTEPRGQLRRFLDLPGAQFDQLYSLARAALHLYDLGRVDGNLLPLLAQWIAWRTNNNLSFDAQRNEIRFAPHLYQSIGLIATVEATVKRITGWESRTKEFIHNIARANEPERLRLMALQRDVGGTWDTAPTPVSINWAYSGRPVAVTEADGSVTFFYHTYRKHGADIWSKQFVGGAEPWAPSQSIADQPGTDKCPAAAMLGQDLWLFWQNYDEAAPNVTGTGLGKWRLVFRTRDANGKWTDTTPLTFADVDTEAATERQMPAAVADGAGGLWLFWLEQFKDEPLQVRYNRFDGVKWQLTPPGTLPPDGGQDPRIEDDLIVLVHPSSATQRLWLFWARHEPGGPTGQTRWTVAFRSKKGLDPTASDWSSVRLLPKPAAPGNDYHDREPAPLLTSNNIELFMSSNRDGSWSIWRSTLDTTTLNFGTVEQITTSVYNERAPLPVSIAGGTLLVFRSNESLTYTSAVFGATHTLDARFAGATTVDTRNKAKIGLQGQFEDFGAYTYDAGENGVRTNDDRLARDTIGLYVAPGAATPDQVDKGISRLRGVLPEFMPATSRAVFIKP
jgi:hypothetical protein